MSDSFILIDKIHQLILNPPKENIQSLLEQSISYTDEQLDQNSIDELFSLIYSCFSQFPNQPDIFLTEIYTNALKSKNRLIIFVMAFSLNNKLSFIPAAQILFSNIEKQIIEYVKAPKDKFIIFNFEIDDNYKANFIGDIILAKELTELTVSTIYPYVFSLKKFSQERKSKLIEKVSNSKLIEYLPEEILTYKYVVKSLTQENLSIIIPKTSDQIFSQILPFLNEYLIESNYCFKPLISSILDKIVEFNMDIKSINFSNQIIRKLDGSMIKTNYWNFFSEHTIILPERISNEIKEFPDNISVLNVIEDFTNVPLTTIFRGLFESDFYHIFERSANSNLNLNECENNEICCKKDFWIHSFSVISNYVLKYSKNVLVFMATVFKKNVNKENLYEYFESMIFDKFPTTEYGNNFLFDLLNEFSSEYKTNFIENLQLLLNKTIETKVIPHPSFWLLFENNFLNQFYKPENTNPMILYAYQFCHCNGSMNHIETLKIPFLNDDEDQIFIIDFIKSRDLDKLVNLNDNLLSFIISAIIFINQEKKSNIEGLTEKNVLPFVTVSFILMDKIGGNFMIESSELKNMLIESCEMSSKSDNLLVIESINVLISFYYDIFNSSLFPSDLAFEIFDTFIIQLINNKYKADKTILLEIFLDFANFESFQYSIYSYNSVIQCLYDKNGINFFKFAYQNICKLQNFDSNKYKLNFTCLTETRIITVLNGIIKKSTIYDDTIYNLAYFLENCCANVPKLNIKDYTNLYKAFNKTLERKEWNKFVHIYGFIKENNTKDFLYHKFHISKESELSYISYILKLKQIETKDYIFYFLFDILMKDYSIFHDHITSLLDKISNNYMIEPRTILRNYSNEYQIYGDLFNKTLQNSFSHFVYKSNDIFVKNFISFNSIKQNSIIKKLFNEIENNSNCLQNALLCLQNIASSFPFLFNKDYIKVFKIVLTSLDSFSLMFADSNKIQKIKISLTALYFLFSCLYSVEVLEFFIPWILNNISSFTSSQILAFSFILLSLFQTKKIKNLILALFLKHKFVYTALVLLKIEINDEDIRKLYKTNILKLLIKYYDELNSLLKKKKIVLIDELTKVDKPVSLMFNKNLTILPAHLAPLNLPKTYNYEIDEFIETISKPKQFWLNYKNEIKNVDVDKVNKFLRHFKKEQLMDDFEIPTTDLIASISSCASKHNWIYQYVVKGKTIPLNMLNHTILRDTINLINELNMRYNSHILYKTYKETNIDYFFRNDLCITELFDLTINEIESNDNVDDDNKIYFELLRSITRDKDLAHTFIKTITIFINANSDRIDSIIKILKAFDHIDVELFYATFHNGVKNLINCSLKPEIRVNTTIVSYILKILRLFDFVNWRACYLLGFFLIHGTYKVLPQIAGFCLKFNERLIKDNMDLIQKAFNELLKNEGITNSSVALVLEGIPSLIKTNMSLAPLLIDHLFTRYNEGDKVGINAIINLMNAITPDRYDDQLIDDETDEIDFSLIESSRSTRNSSRSSSRIIKQVPQNLVKNNPEFWGLYMKYRDSINRIIFDDHNNIKKFKLLTNFPELVNFNIRLLNFRRNLTNKIKDDYEIELYVRRSNVLVDSFEQLNELSKVHWLSKFRVQFIDEKGADYGGLTKEWFTLVIQELFNPNFALFKKVENQSYQPNPLSGINNEHIEYFRFAGKLIARAIIQEQCVNAHFTRSFRRQILHTQLKLNDYEDVDKEIFNSMKSIIENDVEPLCLNFTIDDDEYGVIKTVPLKDKGDEIDVTNENKFEYISLYINYRLRKSIINQVTAFCDGFNWLIPRNEIRLFSQSELDLVICGIPKIDVDDLMENTVYSHPYNKDHKVIKMFFNVISRWNSDNLAKFLIFLTGSSQVPVNGFKDYKERGNPIKITPGGNKNRLCVAHTCFNTLELPEYDNEDDLDRKLLLAIQECNEFALA